MLIGDVVGQFQLVEVDRFGHPLFSCGRTVRVDVHASGHLRVCLPGHCPARVVELIPAIIRGHDVHQQDVLGLPVHARTPGSERREHAPARAGEEIHHETLHRAPPRMRKPGLFIYLPDLVMTISVPCVWNCCQRSAASRDTLGSSSAVSALSRSSDPQHAKARRGTGLVSLLEVRVGASSRAGSDRRVPIPDGKLRVASGTQKLRMFSKSDFYARL